MEMKGSVLVIVIFFFIHLRIGKKENGKEVESQANDMAGVSGWLFMVLLVLFSFNGM